MNSVERGSLKKELNDLQVYTTNWDKLMYYIEISNYNTKEVREAYIKKLDKLSAKVNLSQEDAKIYHEPSSTIITSKSVNICSIIEFRHCLKYSSTL